MIVRKSGFGLRKKTAGANDPVAPSPPEEARVTARLLEGVRLSFQLPEPLHRRLKLHAVRNGGTIVGTISGWVRENTSEV